MKNYSFRLLLAEISLYHKALDPKHKIVIIGFRLLLAEISLYRKQKCNNLTLSLFSSPSGGDQFISGSRQRHQRARCGSFRLLLAEISLYRQSKKRSFNHAICFRLLLAEISLYRRLPGDHKPWRPSFRLLLAEISLYLRKGVLTMKTKQFSFRLLLAEISLYPKWTQKGRLGLYEFSSPSGGDQFISRRLEKRVRRI